MTPKEKAQDLHTSYRAFLSMPNAPLGDMKDEVAKQCALFAVSELLETLGAINTLEKQEGVIWAVPTVFSLWEEVKKELNKF